MRRPIILGSTPYLTDYYRKDAAALFNETGGNSGNLAFMYAVASHVPSAKIMHWGANRQDVRSSGDIIILALANQLGAHTDLSQAAAKLEEFDLPIVGLGLGAQALNIGLNVQLSAGTELWLKTIARLRPADSPNIGVRGPYTLKQIISRGYPHSAIVTGCPSNFINMHDDIAANIARGFKRRPQRIAVTAGIPYLPALAGIEQNLADIVTLTGGAYIVQHGLEMLQLARNEFDKMPPEKLEICRAYISPNRSIDEFKSWCRRYACAHYDARSWMDYVRGFDFVVGTRFHGAMLAIQAGVPAACIAHDSRTQEMCETMGVPVLHFDEIKGSLTQHNLFDYFTFNPEKFKETRRALHTSYMAVLSGADIPVTASLAKF